MVGDAVGDVLDEAEASHTRQRRLGKLRLAAAAAGDMDPSWMDRLLPEGLAWRPRSARSQRWLHGHVKARLGLARLADAFASTPSRAMAIAILPPAALRGALERLGLVLAGAEVRMAIGRQQVLAYREALGPQLYDFAVSQAPLLRPSGEAGDTTPAGAAHLLARVRHVGTQALQRLLAQESEALWKRVALKLPMAWLAQPPGGPPPELDEVDDRTLLRLFGRVGAADAPADGGAA